MTTISFRRLLGAAILLVGPLVAGETGAQDPRAEVRALTERIDAQEKELAELKAKQTALVQSLERNKEETVKQAEAQPAPAPNRLHIGGYGSLRFEANDSAGAAKGFTLRRFVVTTDARITDRLRIYSETELERLFGIEVEKRATATAGGLTLKQGVEGNNGGEISLEQAWGQYNFTPNHGLRAGVVLAPVGRFNLHHDDDYWDLPRRTLVDRDAPVLPVKSAWRDLGAGLVGGFRLGGQARLDYQAYVLTGATLDFNLESVAQTRNPRRNKLEMEGEFGLASGFFDGSQRARAIAWRAAFSPSLSGEFALSGYHGRYTPAYLAVREPVNTLGFDYKWRKGAFEFEGELLYTSLGRMRRVVDAFAATAFRSSAETSGVEARELESEIEFELGGLNRTRYGFWSDVKYNWRPAWLKRTFLGKPFEDARLIPILRYERVWLNRNLAELGFRNGAVTTYETQDMQQDRLSLGLSYRPVRNFGIQFAYEHNRRVNGAELIFPRIAAASSNGFLSGMVFSF